MPPSFRNPKSVVVVVCRRSVTQGRNPFIPSTPKPIFAR